MKRDSNPDKITALCCLAVAVLCLITAAWVGTNGEAGRAALLCLVACIPALIGVLIAKEHLK